MNGANIIEEKIFKYDCFLRNVYVKSNIFLLSDLGYETMYKSKFEYNMEGNHLVLECDTWHFTDSDNHPNCIDCGTNEKLFIALAAVRNDDNAFFQWFTDGNGRWFLNEDRSMRVGDFEKDGLHRATSEELIHHFK